ncbi:hypothetical protein ACMXYN_11505 [Neptuniibacter sp. PT8_73]|uniref:hypothetical protein n=1 Tax=unclassified Neptuniibacter TaxID=2630693 RepID=UPI0039F7031B
MFLQILGIIFLIIIFIIAFFAWKIYRAAKKHISSDINVAISVLPSMHMELEPSNKDIWNEKERLNFVESELKKIGSSHVGYFRVYQGCATINVSLWNFKHQGVIAIYEATSEQDKENVAFIYEVSCKIPEGSLCLTSNQNAVYDSRPDNHKIIFKESTSVIELLRAIKSELPSGSKVQKIIDPKAYFLECYEDIAEWAWRPEQLNSDKTQQVFSSIGIQPTEDLIEQLAEMGTSYAIEVNINKARRRLAQSPKISAEQWENLRDKLVFINEQMTVDHLIDAIYELAGDLTETQEQALEGFEENTSELKDAIGAFQMLLQALDLKVKRVTTMNNPIKTEVYLPL